MPNTGRPSKDCHLCRRRRVKCDLARPGCQRCFKYGVDCPGYRDQHELVFRNAHPTAAQKRRKRTPAKCVEVSKQQQWRHVLRVGPEFKSGIDFVATTFITITALVLILVVVFVVIVLLLLLLVVVLVVVLVVMAIVTVTVVLWHVVLPYSPEILDGALDETLCPDPPQHMLHASAAETQREIGTYMGKTLRAVNAALEEPKGAFRNDVLATVWVLASYELLIGSLNEMGPSSPWFLHIRGLYSILQARGISQLYTPEKRIAFWPVYNVVQIQALFSNTECPPESETWLSVIKNVVHDGEEHNICVSVYITKCSHILATVFRLLLQHDFAAAEAQYDSLVRQLEAAEEQVEQFVATWGPIDYTQGVMTYMHNMYLSASIKSHSYILYLANFLTHSPGCAMSPKRLRAQRARCVRNVRAAAQDILDSSLATLSTLKAVRDRAPRVFFDVLRMVWPLTSVYMSAVTTAEQRERAYAALLFIGKDIGVRQALHPSDESGTLPLEARVPLRLEPDGSGGDGDAWEFVG
ncbi:hypothetical protein E4U53_004918 [Claviceps sorghi]|nr:hypothetical protein E4U53_004918 [Claviceps sorghi]